MDRRFRTRRHLGWVVFALAAALATITPRARALPAGTEVRQGPLAMNARQGSRVTLVTPDDVQARIASAIPAFGGFYTDTAGSHIFLSDTHPAITATVQSALRGAFGNDRLPGPVTILRGSHSFRQLKEWKDTLTANFQGVPGVIFTDVDETKNLVTVAVEDLQTQRSTVVEALDALGIPLEAVDVVKSEPPRPATSLIDRHRPLVGGLQIREENSEGCTLGFVGVGAGGTVSSRVLDGEQGFVTASHCTTAETDPDEEVGVGRVDTPTKLGQLFFQPRPQPDPNQRNTAVGTLRVDPPLFQGGSCPAGDNCRYSDSAFVKRRPTPSDRVELRKGHIARTRLNPTPPGAGLDNLVWNGRATFQVIGEVGTSIFVGDVVTKVGQTTGRTQGAVTRTCLDALGFNLLCQFQATYRSGGGDSGAAVFHICSRRSRPPCAQQENTVILYGVHNAGSGTDVGLFSSIGAVELELGQMDTCATTRC